MSGRKWIVWVVVAAVTACPLVCPLRGMLARAEAGASDAQFPVAVVPVCPCCPRPAREDRAPQPAEQQRPGDSCICQGAIVNLDRADTFDVGQYLFGTLSVDAIATVGLSLAAIDRICGATLFDIGPLSGRDRCILRASLRC